MKTNYKRALIFSAPAPNYLSTISVSTAKVISAMLKDGWDVDVVGFKERADRRPDDMLSSLITGARIFSEGSFLNKPSTWCLYAINTGKKLINSYRYDLMISFAHYTWTHIVSYYLKKKYNIPWITFFSDPWGNNPDLRIHSLRSYMEARVLQSCEVVVYSNHRLKDWALSQFPEEKKKIKKKSFVIPYFYDQKLNRFSLISKSQNKIVIRHMGQIPCGGYIISLLYGLKILIDEDNSLKNRLVFECYGRVHSRYKGSVEKLVDVLGLKEYIVFYSEGNKIIHKSYIDSLRLMKEADALLLLGTHPSFFHEWGNTVLPVKLVDYFGVYKPIFALAGEGSVTHELLKDTNGICTNDDPVSIKNALSRFIKNPQLPSPEIRARFSKDKVYPLWQEVFKKVLRKI